jgi:glycosyltransferase involved in cell wall biosynthesis
MKLLIAGAARDIEKYWPTTQRSLDTIFNSISDYKCVIVESNSSDNTLSVLNKWAKDDSRRIILSLGHLNEQVRTKRIAQARNTYLKYFKDNNLFDSYDYLIVLDLDDILNIPKTFSNQLKSCFNCQDENWDAMASNRKDKYYDIWALRSDSEILNCDFDCINIKYDQIRSIRCPHTNTIKTQKIISENNKALQYIKDPSSLFKNIPTSTGFIPCTSAFGGMVLYKTKSIINKTYNGDETCEHISFNEGLKMYINSEFISG